MEILIVGYLPTFFFERRFDNCEEKRFVNLISNINHRFVNSFCNDSDNKKIVLNLAIRLKYLC